MEFMERLDQLMEERGIRDNFFVKCGIISNGTIGRWRKGESNPSVPAVIEISNFFGVTTDYLLGLSDDRCPADMLSEKEKILIRAYRAADDEGQMNIICACMNEKRKAESAEVKQAQ